MDIAITESPIVNKKVSDSVWQHVLYKLSEFQGEDTQWSLVVHRYRWFLLAELIRIRWDSKFRIARQQADLKKSIQQEGEFWNSVLDLISEVFLLKPRYEHPAIWFSKVFNEYELWVTFHNLPEGTNKTQLLEMIRKQNQEMLILKKDSNPFQQEATRTLIGSAMSLADEKDRFRTRFYTPFVKKRMALTSFAAQKEASVRIRKADGSSRPLRQGRKKNAEQ